MTPWIFCLFAVLLAAPAAAAPDPGRLAFDAAGCRSCHSVGGLGGNAGPDLTLVGFRRGRDWLDRWLRDPRAWKPDTLMPDPRLSESSRRAVVDYLAGLRWQDFAGAPPWAAAKRGSPEAGRVIFARAGCVACHGVEGRGGHPNNNVAGARIPALSSLAETYTAEELRAKIRRGARPEKADPAGAEPMAAMPAWGEALSDGDIDSVAAYLLALRPANKTADW